MNIEQILKHVGIIGLVSLVVSSLVYYCTINEYYKNDISPNYL